MSHIQIFQKENLIGLFNQNPIYRGRILTKGCLHRLLLAQVPAQLPAVRWRVHMTLNMTRQQEAPKTAGDVEALGVLVTPFQENHSLKTQS